MPTVFVSENIERIERAIDKLRSDKEDLRGSITKQMEEIQEEIFRLEGCHLTFKGFDDAGISKLVPDDEMEVTYSHEQEQKPGHHNNHEQEQEKGHHNNHEQEQEKEDEFNFEPPKTVDWIKNSCHLI